jgi:hypothetical protein
MVINIKTEKIMKKILKISIVFLAALLVTVGFNSCDDENDYNFNKVIPKIWGIKGVSEFVIVKTLTHEFEVDGRRGGSVYTWSVIEGSDIISIAAQEDSYKATLTIIGESADSVDLAITVYETTATGVSSDPDTLEIQGLPYCALDISQFDGEYDELADDGSSPEAADVTIAQDLDDEYFGLIITNFGFSSSWWGGYEDATLEIKLNNCDQSVMVHEQVVGNLPTLFAYGPCTVFLTDDIKGTFVEATKHIEFSLTITVDAGSFGNCDYTYDPK